jgi:hypothetical protein
MKNRLIDLNNHLFEELERLNDPDLPDEKMGGEIVRAKAMSQIATQLIANAKLALETTKLQMEYSHTNTALPTMLTEPPKGNGK